jgi:cell division protein FtsZ
VPLPPGLGKVFRDGRDDLAQAEPAREPDPARAMTGVRSPLPSGRGEVRFEPSRTPGQRSEPRPTDVRPTRPRTVVFDDDDLDVPDFLK